MANVNDYLPGGKNDPQGGINAEITDAQGQQEARQRDPNTGQFIPADATPQVDWETRYKELETLNSRQAQDLGTYRQMVDDYITSPTPAQPVVEEAPPLTNEDFYDNPADALTRAVEAHPAIQEARQLKVDIQKRDLEDSFRTFQGRHPDYNEISSDPAFRNWVEGDVMRQELYARGNSYDLSAADALFSLYKAENNITQMTDEQQQQTNISAATLEESSALQVQEPARYSRSEYVDTLTRAKQGDMEAEKWIQRNAAAYREALGIGNVRD